MNADHLPGSLSREASSFRDPAGFIYRYNGEIFRQVNLNGKDDYDLLVDSGLYDRLVQRGQIVPHEEVDAPAADPDFAYKIIRPAALDFISYPYE